MDPKKILSDHLSVNKNILRVGKKNYSLSQVERIFVVGTGKASAAMAANLEKILGSRITAAGSTSNTATAGNLKRIHIQEAGHPLPDAKGLEGAREIVRMLNDLTEKDWSSSSSPGRFGPASLPGSRNYPGGKAEGHGPAVALRGHHPGDQHAEKASFPAERRRAGQKGAIRRP